MASDVQTRENLAVNYGGQATYATVFTADPGTSITNELAGVTRQALTWAAGTVDGTVTASATFAIPSGTTITHAGTVSAVTGGRLIDKVVAAYSSQTSAGQLVVNFTYSQN